ncbi:hypothetical protein ABFS82_03G036000 [Erythranthe guttata]|uniref:transcription factor bHLH84 n=1 Tax=Erythranthe guttata TaxID=4155 RepID=UPI00064DB082|nr:PREDICTED: transcription factor bHLH84 [Erythranthe guttata]|eukprot:XP_012851556.1 PREDICTED: transcription factor bHLH84 [Erythranthe guttata]
MEFVESFLDQEWESLSKMFSIGENNPDLLPFPSNYCENMANEGSSLFLPSSSCEIDHTFHNNVYRVPQESSNSNNNGVSFHHHEEEYLTNNTFDECMNYYTSMMVPVFSDDVIMEEMFDDQSGGHNNGETDDSCKDIIRLKRKYEAEEEEPIIDEPSKRKPRVSRNKNQKAANQSKKKKKMIGEDEEDINNEENNMIISNDGGGNNQISSSSCSSEDIHDSITNSNNNASESKLDSVSLKSLNGKAKANRGSATDPQSLYARKRRERINERLKILQNLVPNGTKVDISTMLEEAVQYVKFLQLQIKLLSSDDLWMYAPIAYNGMDIGMYQKISPNFCL